MAFPLIFSGILASPLARKIIGYAMVLGLAIFLVKWYGGAREMDGIYKERMRKTEELEKQLIENQKLMRSDLSHLREINTQRIQTAAAAEAELKRQIEILEKQLLDKVDALMKLREERYEEADNIPADQLDDALRAQSRRLAGQQQPPE